MHDQAFFFVQRASRDMTARRLRIIEIGAKDINGSVRPIFEGHDYTASDIAPGPGVDIVCDGATVGETGAYDVGICCETLEHAPNAAAIVANLRRIVRPGGMLILTAATDPRAPHSGDDGRLLNGGGEYYRNVAPADLLAWLDGCPYVNVEVERGPGDVRALVMV